MGETSEQLSLVHAAKPGCIRFKFPGHTRTYTRKECTLFLSRNARCIVYNLTRHCQQQQRFQADPGQEPDTQYPAAQPRYPTSCHTTKTAAAITEQSFARRGLGRHFRSSTAKHSSRSTISWLQVCREPRVRGEKLPSYR